MRCEIPSHQKHALNPVMFMQQFGTQNATNLITASNDDRLCFWSLQRVPAARVLDLKHDQTRRGVRVMSVSLLPRERDECLARRKLRHCTPGAHSRFAAWRRSCRRPRADIFFRLECQALDGEAVPVTCAFDGYVRIWRWWICFRPRPWGIRRIHSDTTSHDFATIKSAWVSGPPWRRRRLDG